MTTPTAAPFDVRPVAERLRAHVPALRQIGTAADLAAVTKLADFPTPAVYVLLARERGQDTKSGIANPGQQARMAQVVPVTFGIVVSVRNYREQAGAQVTDSLVDILAAVRSAIGGWTPPGNGTRPCQLVQGDLKDYDHATALWIDVWHTQHILRFGAST